MKSFYLLLAGALLGGCANYDTVQMADVTEQTSLGDLDGDGVIDRREQCQGSKAGTAVDNVGCSRKLVESLNMSLELSFANDSYEINAQDIKRIGGLAEYLKLYPDLSVTLSGHASKVGSEEYNDKLGLARANAVRVVLIDDYGIDPSRINVASYGFHKLKKTGDSDSIHASNRRVEITSQPHETQSDVMKWGIYTPGK